MSHFLSSNAVLTSTWLSEMFYILCLWTHMFSQLCHVCVSLSTGALTGGLVGRGGGGTVAADSGRRNELPVRAAERRGLLPPRRGPIAAVRGTRVWRGGGGREGRRVRRDSVCYPLAYLKAERQGWSGNHFNVKRGRSSQIRRDKSHMRELERAFRRSKSGHAPHFRFHFMQNYDQKIVAVKS